MKLLYISDGWFPFGSAYASRLLNFSRLFHEIGFDVHVIADFTADDYLIDGLGNGSFENTTFTVIGDRYSLLTRVALPRKCLTNVKRFLDNNHIDCVVMKSLSDRFEILYSEIKRRKIPLILESCEWYDSFDYRGGIVNPWYVQFQKCWVREYRKADGFITISRLLEYHYKQANQKVIRIPTIIDSASTPFNNCFSADPIKLIYAGNPGVKKELFFNIFTALSVLGEDRKRFSLDIYGPSISQILKQSKSIVTNLNDLKDIVRIHGKISQEQINAKLMQSDFGIFLRDNTRKNRAGFPTKLAESMMAGTPMICNDTGDIGMFVHNKRNGFLLEDTSPYTVEGTLREILELSRDQKFSMRKEARRTAEEHFDYRNYIEEMKAFISLVCHEKSA